MNEETINHIKCKSSLEHLSLSPFLIKLYSYSTSKHQVTMFLHPFVNSTDHDMLDLLKVYVLLMNFMAIFIIGMAAIIAQRGSDAWWLMTVEDLLPEKYREKASEYEKGTDTMDVWFDSGTMIMRCQKYLKPFFSFLFNFLLASGKRIFVLMYSDVDVVS